MLYNFNAIKIKFNMMCSDCIFRSYNTFYDPLNHGSYSSYQCDYFTYRNKVDHISGEVSYTRPTCRKINLDGNCIHFKGRRLRDKLRKWWHTS